jgi:hypothetical protein
MIKMLSQAALLAACGLAMGACTPTHTSAPAKKPPAADYQAEAPKAAAAANIKSICYNEADLTIFRMRMVQQEIAVATLQCQNPGGVRALEALYTQFLNKYRSELSTNTRELQQLANRKRLNVDVVVTQFANRTAHRPPVDPKFCDRSLRALEWSLAPEVKTLTQVPPMYDLGPEMNVYPCPKP